MEVMDQNTYTKRMVLVLALMVIALIAISMGQLTGGGEQEQAAVLRAYAE